jgi:hypothetical protein
VTFENLTEGWHTFNIDSEDIEGNRASTLSHSWFVDTTPPINQFTSHPSSLSNDSNVLFVFSCTNELFPCTYLCSFDQEKNKSCSNSVTYNVNLEKNYEFIVYAIDEANNVGNSLSFQFKIDLTPPTISQLNDITVDNCDSASPNITGIPIVNDDFDSNPKIFYSDESNLDSCCTIRNWFATDSSGNLARMRQTIYFLNPTVPYVDDKEELLIPCNELDQIYSTLSNKKLNVIQKCKSKLTINYQDSTNSIKCGISLIRYVH